MALAGERNCGPEPLSRRAPLLTTDALFAYKVEQKVSILLAGFGRFALQSLFNFEQF